MKVPVWLRSCRCTELRITEGVTRQRIEQTPPSGETVCKYVGPVCHSFHKHAHFCPWTGMPRTWRIPGSQFSPRFPTKWAQEVAPSRWWEDPRREIHRFTHKGRSNQPTFSQNFPIFLCDPELGQAELAQLGGGAYMTSRPWAVKQRHVWNDLVYAENTILVTICAEN